MKTGKDSVLSQVINLVEEAQSSQSRTQNLVDRFAMYLTLIALTGGFITLVTWMVLTGQDLAFSLERAVTVMVTTCPHALGLAIPLVVAVSTALSASNGLLIRNRTSFEKARNIDAIIFDKTGTLTEGEFGVTRVIPLDDLNPEEILKYAASLESHSEHPIARGVAAELTDHLPVENFRSIPGKGVEGVILGKEVKIVSSGYLTELGFKLDNTQVDELLSRGKTTVFVIINGQLKGVIALTDIIRPESKETVSRFKKWVLSAS